MLVKSQISLFPIAPTKNLDHGFIFTKGYFPNKLKEINSYDKNLEEDLSPQGRVLSKFALIQCACPQEDDFSKKESANYDDWYRRFLLWTIFYELKSFYLSDEVARKVAEERADEFYRVAEDAFHKTLNLFDNKLGGSFMRYAFLMIRAAIRELLDPEDDIIRNCCSYR